MRPAQPLRPRKTPVATVRQLRALDTGADETGVQLYADHELFHATHPTEPTVSSADSEVAA